VSSQLPAPIFSVRLSKSGILRFTWLCQHCGVGVGQKKKWCTGTGHKEGCGRRVRDKELLIQASHEKFLATQAHSLQLRESQAGMHSDRSFQVPRGRVNGQRPRCPGCGHGLGQRWERCERCQATIDWITP